MNTNNFTAILKLLDDGAAKSGSVLSLLHKVTNAVDDMGGTLGAIFGILLAAFAVALKSHASSSSSSSSDKPDINIFAPSLTQAVESLKQHTGARIGDRTVMDVLLPFAETLNRERSMQEAVRSAENAAEWTRGLKARFGRASYVGETGGEEQALPDPGAWALMVMLRGVRDGWE